MGVATVAVLFTDLAGSTAAAVQAGPEATDRSRREHFGALRRAVADHQGTEVKTTGDGLMVVFASPSDAVACAVAMHAADLRLSRLERAGPRLRIGIGLGEAMEEGGDWFGVTVIRSARLCDAAAPGQTLVDQFVAALAGYVGAQFEPRGELELRGLDGPAPAFAVIGPSPGSEVPLPHALGLPAEAVFVGRQDPLEDLRRAWRRVEDDGITAIALIGGEPGTGKTSLAAAFARLVSGDGATVLFGRCDEGGGPAYQPFAQALSHYVRHADQGDLRTHTGEHGGELSRLVPHLATRLADLPAPVDGDPSSDQWRLFDATHALLAVAGRGRGVLLVIDDLHWASSGTLQMLMHVLQAEPPARLLVVSTYRDTELDTSQPLADVLADLRRHPATTRIRLRGLDEAETDDLVRALAGDDLDAGARPFIEALHQRTEGNPFFAVELLRHLVDQGALERRDGRWNIEVDIDESVLPEGIREVVSRRLRRLPPRTIEVLEVAAVAGAHFDAEVVGAVLGVDLLDGLERLDPARSAGFVVETSRANRFAFAHALTRSTIQDQVGVSRRVDLHRRIAEAIEEVHAADLGSWLADLAHHHARGAHPGSTAAAVHWALAAADQARRSAANADAIGLLEQGLVAARLADPPDATEVTDLLVALAETTAVDDPLAARAYATEAGSVAEAAGLGHQLGAAAASLWSLVNTTNVGAVDGDRWLIDLCDLALGAADALTPSIRARVLGMSALLHLWVGDEVEAENVRHAVGLAAEAGDVVTSYVVASASYGTDLTHGLTPGRARAYLELLESSVDADVDWQIKGMAAVSMAMLCSTLGDAPGFALARQRIETARDTLGSPRLASWSAWLEAMEGLRRGAWDQVLAATTAARDVTVDPLIGDVMWAVHTGSVLLHQGRAGEILAYVGDVPALGGIEGSVGAYRALVEALAGDDRATATIDGVLALGPLRGQPSGLATVGSTAWAVAVAGHRDAAPAVEEALRRYTGLIASGGIVEIGAVDRLLGMMLALQGRHDEADGWFRSGLELETAFGATVPATHTRYWWATSLLDRGRAADVDQASELIADCVATADPLGMTQIATDARALLF